MSKSTELYELDFHAWTQETADQIRVGRFEDIDLEMLAEEIESLGRSDRNELHTRLSLIAAHMLKWEFQPEKRELHGRGWALTVKEQRRRVERLIKKNPSLQPVLADMELIQDAYESGVIQAALESGIVEQDFPRQCPYTATEMLTYEFWSDR